MPPPGHIGQKGDLQTLEIALNMAKIHFLFERGPCITLLTEERHILSCEIFPPYSWVQVTPNPPFEIVVSFFNSQGEFSLPG